MISKELLSKVLGYEVKEVLGMLENSANKTILSYIFEDASLNEGKRIINIYELAHKCKEWAITKDYYLQITIKAVKICEEISPYYHIEILDEYNYGRQSIREARLSEPEAIFKACQWILDNK